MVCHLCQLLRVLRDCYIMEIIPWLLNLWGHLHASYWRQGWYIFLRLILTYTTVYWGPLPRRGPYHYFRVLLTEVTSEEVLCKFTFEHVFTLLNLFKLLWVVQTRVHSRSPTRIDWLYGNRVIENTTHIVVRVVSLHDVSLSIIHSSPIRDRIEIRLPKLRSRFWR